MLWYLLSLHLCYGSFVYFHIHTIPDSKVHEAYMEPTWGRRDPGARCTCILASGGTLFLLLVYGDPDCIKIGSTGTNRRN